MPAALQNLLLPVMETPERQVEVLLLAHILPRVETRETQVLLFQSMELMVLLRSSIMVLHPAQPLEVAGLQVIILLRACRLSGINLSPALLEVPEELVLLLALLPQALVGQAEPKGQGQPVKTVLPTLSQEALVELLAAALLPLA